MMNDEWKSRPAATWSAIGVACLLFIIPHSLFRISSWKSRVVARVDGVDGTGRVSVVLDVGRRRLRLAQRLLQGGRRLGIRGRVDLLAFLPCQDASLEQLLLEKGNAVRLVSDSQGTAGRRVPVQP